jgi:hypothetical protein
LVSVAVVTGFTVAPNAAVAATGRAAAIGTVVSVHVVTVIANFAHLRLHFAVATADQDTGISATIPRFAVTIITSFVTGLPFG